MRELISDTRIHETELLIEDTMKYPGNQYYLRVDCVPIEYTCISATD